ncbi:transcriptional regulator [Auriculariales sp. MPI-PUGE-AT-0066]|nr:transcriptional regulator [Auriculariales sp. MPI-PUGE-AT-0066]
MATATETLTVAICLFPDVQLLDFSGPVDLLGFLSPKNAAMLSAYYKTAPPTKLLDLKYLAADREVVQPTSGPGLTPDATYGEALESGKQYDVILVPGGGGVVDPPESLIKFIATQFHGAKYFMSVCTGSWAVAKAGVLEGRRATTNKATYRIVVVSCTSALPLVPKARWVVDGNYWSASGVAAGLDMTTAWLEHYVGKEATFTISSLIEYTGRKQDDDEWAPVHGLV